jgi:hypothetical protein
VKAIVAAQARRRPGWLIEPRIEYPPRRHAMVAEQLGAFNGALRADALGRLDRRATRPAAADAAERNAEHRPTAQDRIGGIDGPGRLAFETPNLDDQPVVARGNFFGRRRTRLCACAEKLCCNEWRPGRKEIGWWDWKSHRPKSLKCLKSCLLYQNDDFGKDFLKGFSDRLGDKAKQVMTRAVSYEVTDATVDSQIIDLASTKTNVFLNITTPKFAVQAIRKAHELGWKPMQFVDNPAASIGVVMRPAGVEAAKGIISAAFVKDPTDPQYKDDPEFQAWVAWMKKYYSAGSLEDPQNVVGYVQAQTMVQVLKQCGDTLTRENVMKQAANLKDFHPAMLLKGINMNTSATDYQPMEELLLQRFNGERFEVFGDLLSARVK